MLRKNSKLLTNCSHKKVECINLIGAQSQVSQILDKLFCFEFHMPRRDLYLVTIKKNHILFFFDWETDPFTVADLAQANLRQAELAFVSACRAGGSPLMLLEDTLNMAGAFHLARFRCNRVIEANSR